MKKIEKMSGRQLLIFIVFLGFVFAFVIPEPKAAIMLSLLLALFLAALFYGRKMTEGILLAGLFSLFINSYNPHIYTTNDILIGNISLFSFVSWTAGLVALKEIYNFFQWRYKFVISSLVYIVSLLIFEYIGYHLLGIRLIGNEPSYFGLGVLHGPPSMHIIYTLAGPLYLASLIFLRLK